MRGLKKIAWEGDRQTHRQTHRQTQSGRDIATTRRSGPRADSVITSKRRSYRSDRKRRRKIQS